MQQLDILMKEQTDFVSETQASYISATIKMSNIPMPKPVYINFLVGYLKQKHTLKLNCKRHIIVMTFHSFTVFFSSENVLLQQYPVEEERVSPIMVSGGGEIKMFQ